MLTRIFYTLRDRPSVAFCLFLFMASIIYLYIIHIQENYNNSQKPGERCMSELTSVKYQLNVVTEYKNRIDKLLTETQQTYESEKTHFKDIMESCVAMKQQSSICQSQFEDLQRECRKVREDYDKLKKELEQLKSAR